MISKDDNVPLPFKCLQFPVLGAYYLPFNQFQGQSLSKLGIHLPRCALKHGKLFVGFSRVTDQRQVSVYAKQTFGRREDLYKESNLSSVFNECLNKL